MLVARTGARVAIAAAAPRALRGLATSAAMRNPKHETSSTSAHDYKIHHPHRQLPPLPTIEPPRMQASEAVGNILYNTPAPSSEPLKRHTLTALVQDEPGVLSRVAGTLAARGFNIDNLLVASTEVPDLSRMCIVLKGQDAVVEQARRQLEDLVPVWAVLDYTHTRTIERELMLAKVSLLGPEYYQEQVSRAAAQGQPTAASMAESAEEPKLPPDVQAEREPVPARPPGPPPGMRLSPTDALRIKGEHLRHIIALAEQFQGRVVDVSTESVIVEMSGKSRRCEALLKLLRPFGIIECARSGTMALPRAKMEFEDEEKFENDVHVDASLLPPG